MLELAVMSGDGRMIYTQRFRPATLRRWRSYPHGITPEMVENEPLFAECRQEIQSIIDAASHVIGFAVAENDLRKLRQEGIHTDESLGIVEIRDWFRLTHGLENGLDYRQNVGLNTCCRELGIDIDESKEHSAAYDTECTLGHSPDCCSAMPTSVAWPTPQLKRSSAGSPRNLQWKRPL